MHLYNVLYALFLPTLNKFYVSLPESHLSVSSFKVLRDRKNEGWQEGRQEEEVIAGSHYLEETTATAQKQGNDEEF